jgi:3-oxoacyl-[acyl-carrier protein] reductase
MTATLEGEVAIVTGAAAGLGAAIADALESEGARVARTDLAGTELELDVRARESVEAAVHEVTRTLGVASVLVNNAGVARIGQAEELAESDWGEVVEINLTGAFRCAQVVGRLMLEAGRGSIVNVSSILGMVGAPGRAAYCATKSGLVGLTRVLALDWAARSVRVNAVCPGYARTPMVEAVVAAGHLFEADIRSRTPGARLVEPSEVGRAVVFLSSPDASFITGQTLVVDGGYLAYGAPSILHQPTV